MRASHAHWRAVRTCTGCFRRLDACCTSYDLRGVVCGHEVRCVVCCMLHVVCAGITRAALRSLLGQSSSCTRPNVARRPKHSVALARGTQYVCRGVCSLLVGAAEEQLHASADANNEAAMVQLRAVQVGMRRASCDMQRTTCIAAQSQMCDGQRATRDGRAEAIAQLCGPSRRDATKGCALHSSEMACRLCTACAARCVVRWECTAAWQPPRTIEPARPACTD